MSWHLAAVLLIVAGLAFLAGVFIAALLYTAAAADADADLQQMSPEELEARLTRAFDENEEAGP